MRSYYLVFAQVVLTLWLLIPGVLSRWNSAGVVLIIAGAALGLWALSTNRLGNFRVLPEIKQGAHLVKSGPYRWVCHPMYTALLLVTLGSLICKFTGLRFAAWLGLVAVLCAKALREERLLRGQFSEYAAYRAHTGRFLPWL
jgi:protein-S-isoprenylcysteine O-methyltransferase Ste14